jgi:peptidoglycan/xylan/chitin deacetylase (PgdA/CDA1 family)
VSPQGPQFYAPSLPGGGKTVALTFDDGPGPSTASILAILEAYGVRATFFNVGVQEAAWPQDLVAEARAGFLIGSHTWNHPDMVKLPAAAQARELDLVAARQLALTRSAPCVFRPPYGDYDATTLRLAAQRHMAVWMWSVDTEDYEAEGSGSAYWVDRIVSLAESEGSTLRHPVVVLHNQEILMPATVAALPVIIEYFLSHGYTFVDLLGNAGPPASCEPGGTSSRPVSSAAIEPGRLLGSGDVVDSPGAQYRLVMRSDGDLVLETAGGRILWSSATGNSPGAFALMLADGDFAIYSSSDQMLWETGTAGYPGADLAVQDNGDLVIYDGSQRRWSSGSANSELSPGERLEPGWYLDSPGGTCRLVMKRNGDLVFYAADGRALWSSGTPGSPGAFAFMKSDGDLAVYSALDRLLWQTKTADPGASLRVKQQADAAVELGSGPVLWVAR